MLEFINDVRLIEHRFISRTISQKIGPVNGKNRLNFGCDSVPDTLSADLQLRTG